MYDDKINGIIAEDDFIRIYRESNREKESISNKVKELRNIAEDEESNIDYNKIIEDLVKFKEIDKSILVQLIDRITMTQDKEITIYYKFNLLNEMNNDNKFVEIKAS